MFIVIAENRDGESREWECEDLQKAGEIVEREIQVWPFVEILDGDDGDVIFANWPENVVV